MSETTEVQPDAVTKVARNLSAIEDLMASLPEQALHKANDRLMPGGVAMVALGPDANLREWAERIAYAELHHFATCEKSQHRRCTIHAAEHVEDEDEDDQDPLRTLLFWSEAWRDEHGYPLEGRTPTLVTEGAFIRHMLTWAWENEPHFTDFANDIHRVRQRLEGELRSGTRVERGVPCMAEECKGKWLARKLEPTRDEDGRKVWRYGKWHCPTCKRSWDDDEYRRNIEVATELARTEIIDDEVWCSVDYAAEVVERPESTIRVWIHRGELPTLCILAGKRVRFVHLASVQARHELAVQRAEKRKARKQAA